VIGGDRIDLAYHGPNHSPDNIVIHLPDHDTLMLVDIVAADVFTEDVAFMVMQSVRLDLGYGSWVHP
jgi:glyoxylase-like metal-dependent hydrolase (beta-lactamase superfamily II)